MKLLPIADWLYYLEFDRLDQLAMGLALSLGAAELSYRYVEAPALRLKRRLRDPKRPEPSTSPTTWSSAPPLGGVVPR